MAEEVQRSPAQIALRWVMQQPGVTAPIVGARTTEQLSDNLGAADFTLTDEQLRRLGAASEIALPYPYNFIGNAARRDQRVR